MSAHLATPDVAATVRWVVSDTFEIPQHLVLGSTRPEDVDGWDSLGHSIVLTRLTRKLGLAMSEELAAPITDVQEFVDRLSALLGRGDHG